MISIVVPMYNEEASVGDDLRSIQATMAESGLEFEIIVVDDGSTDRSAEIVQGFEGVCLLQHPRNRGTGAARTTGLRAARGHIVVMTDADSTYPNHEIPRLVEMVESGHSMVIGARRREAGTLPWLRAPAKWFIRKLASYLTATRIPDLNSGLRAFERETVLRYVNLLPNTHSWVSTITIALLSDGYSVAWHPIDYYPRKGHSSFHPIADTYNYISLVVRSVTYFNPLKVFLPISLFFVVAGLIKMMRDFIYYQGFYVPAITLTLLVTGIQLGAIGMLADLIVKRSRL
ncbi:MAG: glycosyltransferase family 2 protein [Anaerolineae bacterium]|nr:glycosyltransferase family 2 protein [Anaerolineae bacterium]